MLEQTEFSSIAGPTNFPLYFLPGPLALLPYIEQSPIYNAFNFNIHFFSYPNTTIEGTGLTAIWCPSDPTAAIPYTIPAGDDPSVPTTSTSYHNSYFACSGTWMMPGRYEDPQTSSFTAAYAQGNGVVYFYSHTTIASITDGTSNTMAQSECSMYQMDLCNSGDQVCWHWWCSGNYGDSLYCTLLPMNLHGRTGDPGSDPGINSDGCTWTPSSQHPGGANFAFCDGSVHFLKNTIQTSYNPATGLPYGYSATGGTNTTTGLLWVQTMPNGIYQALSTRAGGEVVSSDAY